MTAKWKDGAEFKKRVIDFSEKMKIDIKSLSLRPMTNKWASCSTDGNLNFNKELLDLEKDLGDYVIVHELLHFKVPNHGKLWKSLMSAYLGDYEKSENRLSEIVSENLRTVKPIIKTKKETSQAKIRIKRLKKYSKLQHKKRK